MARIYSQAVRVGEVYPTNGSGDLIIISYNSSRDVCVEFADGRTKNVTARNIVTKQVKNEFAPNIDGVGYLGIGEFRAYDANHKATREYGVWKGMIDRCYDTECQQGSPTYKDCFVCEDWHNFQNFAAWYTSQQGYTEGWHLDKDLTIVGNREYSAQACSLIPREVNNILVNSKAKRGEFPLGVYYDKKKQVFIARISRGKGVERIGSYNNPTTAFNAYKELKEDYIKVVANKHKSVISSVMYDNLINHTISITD